MFKKNKTNPGHTTASTSTHSKGRGIAKLAGGLPILLLALAAFAVALAGVSVIRHEVGENSVGYGGSLDYTWFVVFFNLFVLLCCAIHLIGAGVGRMPLGTSAVAGLLAVATVLTILETQRWNVVRRAVGRNDKAGKGVTTLFAGYISLAVLDGLLILILGNQTDSKRAHGSTTTTTHYAHPNEGNYPAGNTTGMAHATTTATPQGVNVV